MVACSAVALALAVPVIAGAQALAVAQQLQGATDNAALAAADAATGWLDETPCAIAARVLDAARAELRSCDIDERSGAVRIRAAARTMLGTAQARARAGPPVT